MSSWAMTFVYLAFFGWGVFLGYMIGASNKLIRSMRGDHKEKP
jgi:hypothetical protein